MEISKEAYEALIKYFNGLTHTGYRPYGEVYQLLALLFIEEILYGEMSMYITEEDYKAITDAMYCLYGSCLLPYPSYLEGRATIRNNVLDKYRTTETEILRNSNNHLRVTI